MQPAKITKSLIGEGRMGGVYRVGDQAVKHAKNRDGVATLESEVYAVLAGTEGIAPGITIGDYIRTPFYPLIISVHDIPTAERRNFTGLVARKQIRIQTAIDSLSFHGYVYNDIPAFGIDENEDCFLFDFSNCSRRTPRYAAKKNARMLAIFLTEFDCHDH